MKSKLKFKETELGQLPDDWDIDRLKDHLYIKGRIGWKGLKKSEYLEEGYAIINGEQIQKGKLDWSTCGRITKERYDESPEIQLKDNDIVMTKDGTIGKLAYIDKLPEPTSVASGIFVIRNNSKKLIQRYLYYYFKSHYFKWLTDSRIEGSVVPHLYQRDLVELKIPLPSIKEQERIAKTLHDFDKKIELLLKQYETLDKLGRMLFKQWLVNFEFSKNQKMIDSDIGDIPEGWEIKSLDEIAHYLNGLALQKYPAKGKEYLPVIKIREMKQGVTDNTDKADTDIPSEYIIDDGDIIFSWSGSLDVVIWCNGLGALNQHLFKVSSEDYPKWFYYHWTLHHLEQFKRIAADKATTMGHIKRKHLSDAKVVIPPKKTIDEMDKLLYPIVDKQIMLKVQARNLAKMRDLLLPRLMSGKMRVES